IRYCASGSAIDAEFNVVNVDTGGRAPEPVARLSTTTSSCGWCGTAAIDDLVSRLTPLDVPCPISLDTVAALPATVAGAQGLFATTGGVHAAAAFDADGALIVVREDIGRHNAVDKVVGRLLLDGRLPAHQLGLFVSGRASFEIVQK